MHALREEHPVTEADLEEDGEPETEGFCEREAEALPAARIVPLAVTQTLSAAEPLPRGVGVLHCEPLPVAVADRRDDSVPVSLPLPPPFAGVALSLGEVVLEGSGEELAELQLLTVAASGLDKDIEGEEDVERLMVSVDVRREDSVADPVPNGVAVPLPVCEAEALSDPKREGLGVPQLVGLQDLLPKGLTVALPQKVALAVALAAAVPVTPPPRPPLGLPLNEGDLLALPDLEPEEDTEELTLHDFEGSALRDPLKDAVTEGLCDSDRLGPATVPVPLALPAPPRSVPLTLTVTEPQGVVEVVTDQERVARGDREAL